MKSPTREKPRSLITGLQVKEISFTCSFVFVSPSQEDVSDERLKTFGHVSVDP